LDYQLQCITVPFCNLVLQCSNQCQENLTLISRNVLEDFQRVGLGRCKIIVFYS